ncbi:TatD family deoxyribonuclease [Thalassotalea sp. HSM 43]|uniref:TatD family hydrolase n=1 Tax=Thalassotalea sp. HSM 43 TaxID=2552945 RepID=UPI00108146E3|nr:TatD family hydrolase [Thalassotalea sp. HSM 43]QBY05159.1 TatD family deoxyribonuclease [Thalassotalea sp. HSM 43]
MFTDSHCHLDFREFDDIRDDLMFQCQQLGIKRFIVPGITRKRWSRVLGLAQRYQGITPCLGLHPWWIEKATEQDLWLLQELAVEHNIAAIGEIGIDGAVEHLEKQQEYFAAQLAIAKQLNLPVIVHHRKSHHLIMPHLQRTGLEKAGIVHAFSGNYQQAKAYIDLGFKLGIGGTITYDRAAKTRDAVSKIPLQHIVLETDAPAMPLQGFQGLDNSPKYLPKVFEQLLSLRSESAEVIAEQIEANVNQFLGD